jgi:hypothetical protein
MECNFTDYTVYSVQLLYRAGQDCSYKTASYARAREGGNTDSKTHNLFNGVDKTFQGMYPCRMSSTRSYSYSKEVIHAAIRGHCSGQSQRYISDVLKVPRTTLREWIHHYALGKLDRLEDIPRHPHYWVIPSPKRGGEVTGTCKVCFETRVFQNTLPEGLPWGVPKLNLGDT